ncbi:MAG: glutaminase A [Burkholderiales bacterium]|nr:glutaminase A [Burkholderiales bacterium]
MLTSSNPGITASPIETYLKELHARHASLHTGRVADYIPELAKADPNLFGICIATRDGHVYEVGDSRAPFTIQSISKALTYGLALEDRGEEFMLSRIGVEPSGDAFNAISLKPDSGAPFNPMINAGAIAACGQILATGNRSRIARILEYLSSCAGRALDIDAAVYRSESDTGHRNRAIGWMLRNFGIIDEEPTAILETYFQQCAIRVSCRDLAIIGATLANDGRNPLTREQAIAPECVDNVLSVMASSGMYDFSGEWLYRVGLPAKSGVGGGILAVLPGQLGIGVFSPPLDQQGNSARGIRVCADLSRELSLHLFAGGAAPQPTVRLWYDASQVSSRRRRSNHHQQTLRGSGHRIRLVELQGELVFSSFEPVVRLALKQAPYCQYLILNLRNVASVDRVTLRLIAQLRSGLAEQGVVLLICYASRLADKLRRQGIDAAALFADDDAALEHCEDRLLRDLLGPGWDDAQEVGLRDAVLLAGLDADDLAWLDAAMPAVEVAAGDFLIRAGDDSDRLYLLLKGSVMVRLPSATGGTGKRINVFHPGMCFGEMGFLDGSARSADVVAMTAVAARVIDRGLFDRLKGERPRTTIRLLEGLSRQLSANLRRSNAEAAAFKG